jgi:hypothetical protein
MNAVARSLPERGDRQPLLAPLVRTDHTEQFAQRSDRRARRDVRRSPRFCAGSSCVRRASQRNAVVRIERQKQGTQYARPLRLGLAILVKDGGR